MFGHGCCDWRCLSLAEGLWPSGAGWGESLEVSAVGGSPRGLGAAVSVAGSRDGSAGVQAGTCREERVECRWRPWPVLWLLSFLFVCSFCCFFIPKTAELWVWFLSPSLSPSLRLLLVCFSPDLHITRFLGERARVTRCSPSPRGNGGPRWGCSPPSCL